MTIQVLGEELDGCHLKLMELDKAVQKFSEQNGQLGKPLAKKIGKKEKQNKKLFPLLLRNSGEFQNLRRLLKFSQLLLSDRNIMEKQIALLFLHKHPKCFIHIIVGK